MSDTETPAGSHGHAEGHGHDAIHLPPNSWAPLMLALGLTAFFVGFLVGPALWIPGALFTAASIAGWVWAARREYHELPE